MFNFNSSTAGAGNTGSNLFGTPTPSTGVPSLFGSTNTSTAPSSSGLFGTAASTSVAPSVFGSTNTSAAPSSGLFGNATSTSVAANSGGIFGSTNTSAAPTFGGTFGAATSASAAPSSGSMFGGGTSTSAAPTSGNLFGSTGNTSAAPSFGSTFGGGTSTSAAPSSGNMFGGATSTSAAASSGGMFGGGTSTSAAPSSGSMFGSAGNTSAEGATITRKTRFVDLPVSVQQQLAAVEKQKHMQIGSSIMADETEREVAEVGQAVQRLAQDLQVAKMTLAGDCERVEDAKRHVTFGIKHAEKGASLIAHATDDGSWAQSGLTPLQVANRQKALQLRVAEPPAAFITAEGGLQVDEYEVVRRIQVASIHYDVASEYYWAWLTRVESSTQLLAERLDQLERHITAAINQSSVDSNLIAKVSPKAVSDVIQYQNDSFLAIAAKVAALDEDVRKLVRSLSLKDAVKCPASLI
ncbi:hypothetical protein H4S08_004939 [Coemansia sp. RSA 1365]|nr:hypothetical protein H4S08_004939 [Coemansia sp. RSA 1365]